MMHLKSGMKLPQLLKLANLYQLLKKKLENMSQHYPYNFKLTRIIHYKSIKLLKNHVK